MQCFRCEDAKPLEMTRWGYRHVPLCEGCIALGELEERAEREAKAQKTTRVLVRPDLAETPALGTRGGAA